MDNNRKTESGNALWFILLAIILLGGLTVMMSRSSNTSGDTGDYERRQIHASEIMRYAKGIEVAVSTMKTRGCSENEVSFETSAVAGYANASAPTDESCHVFETAGGGQVYKTPKDDWLVPSDAQTTRRGDWFFTGDNNVSGVGTSAGEELLIFLPYIHQSLCIAINDLLGVTNPSGVPPQEDSATGVTQYTGSFGSETISDSGSNLSGEKTGCFQGGDTSYPFDDDHYIFYHVLLTR